MSDQHPNEEPAEGDTVRALEWRLAATRLAMMWENLWQAVWPTACAVGLFIALSLFGIWPAVPVWLHAAALFSVFGFCAWSVWRNRGTLRAPTRRQALHRLELESAQTHRPLAALEDRLALGADSPASRRLWQAHLARARQVLPHLRLVIPRPQAVRADPFGLRLIVGILLTSGLLAAGPDWSGRIAGGFAPAGKDLASPPAQVEAWITPPSYTGMAPIFLLGTNPETMAAPTDPTPASALQVPVNSQLSIRLFGGSGDAVLTILPDRQHTTPTPQEIALSPVNDANYETTTALTRTGTVTLRQNRNLLAQWPVHILPDDPPTIAFADKLSVTERQALRITFDFSDDYGLARAAAELRPAFELARNTTEPAAGENEQSPEIFEFDLPLTAISPAQGKQTTVHDLTAHPWAGLPVSLQLLATDEAGQVGRSKILNVMLPERTFNHPVARAIIEQRRNIALSPQRIDDTITALDALTLYPERFIEDQLVYFGLRVARYRLAIMDDKDAARAQTVDLLWKIALRLEDGDLSLASSELRDLQEELRQALRDGASEAEIEALMQRIREAIDRLLQAMLDEVLEDAMEGTSPPRANEESLPVDNADIEKLLDRIEQLGKAGAREAAQSLLNELQSILDNMRMGFGQGQGEQQIYSDALDGLAELMRQQQALRDETYQQSLPGEPGQQGMPGGAGGGPENNRLSDQQDAMRRQLGELMQSLRQSEGDVPGALGRAEKAMRDAAEALKEGEQKSALDRQGESLEQLRAGAEAVARSMRESGENGQANRGDKGQDPPQETTDPLGRLTPTTGPDPGGSDTVPEQFEVERALELRRELEIRAGQRRRPIEELDYIDRLLKLF